MCRQKGSDIKGSSRAMAWACMSVSGMSSLIFNNDVNLQRNASNLNATEHAFHLLQKRLNGKTSQNKQLNYI